MNTLEIAKIMNKRIDNVNRDFKKVTPQFEEKELNLKHSSIRGVKNNSRMKVYELSDDDISKLPYGEHLQDKMKIKDLEKENAEIKSENELLKSEFEEKNRVILEKEKENKKLEDALLLKESQLNQKTKTIKALRNTAQNYQKENIKLKAQNKRVKEKKEKKFSIDDIESLLGLGQQVSQKDLDWTILPLEAKKKLRSLVHPDRYYSIGVDTTELSQFANSI